MNEVEWTVRIMALSRKMYCVAYSILRNDADCADAVQEAVAKAWQYKDRLNHEEYFETWLIRVLINRCKSELRRRRRRSEALQEECADHASDPAIDVTLRDALMRLKPKYRLPLILHYQDGYSLKEIARILKVSEGLVKSRLYQARAELKKMLGGDEHEA